jgi:hypothetical protein
MALWTWSAELLRIFLVGFLIVTNSSADVGWMPIVTSKSCFVKPALTAIAMPCHKACTFRSWVKNETEMASKDVRNHATWIISGASSPHMCTPTTLFVVAQTIIFMNTRSGSPERVALRGLKLATKTSTSPYSSIACENMHLLTSFVCNIT